jgi:uncharacterized membrane protein
MFSRLLLCLRHRWLDAGDVKRALPRPLVVGLEHQIGQSEARHQGEVRICIEASLPASYLWRHFWHAEPLSQLVRQRALMTFSKLRVWDTAANNGVLIYLLFAERKIEVVADRGLNDKVSQEQWKAVLDGIASRVAKGDLEQGLSHALADVSALLHRFYPVGAGLSNDNELPDVLVIQ